MVASLQGSLDSLAAISGGGGPSGSLEPSIGRPSSSSSISLGAVSLIGSHLAYQDAASFSLSGGLNLLFNTSERTLGFMVPLRISMTPSRMRVQLFCSWRE